MRRICAQPTTPAGLSRPILSVESGRVLVMFDRLKRLSGLAPNRPQRVEPSPDEILSGLPQPFRSALLSMYAGDPQLGEDGEKHSLDGATGISPAEGMWIYDFCRKLKPRATLEIGMAFGFSTIYFLAALAETDDGRHSAIDPNQRRTSSTWSGIGLGHGRRFGGDRFRFIEEPSFQALTHLADQSEQFDLIFVDGSHLFDFALTDFILSAGLCPVGGYIVLDDMWMQSIQRVVAFIKTNRSDFTGVETPVANIAVFQRTGTEHRKWDHFADF